jgi:hypothetical protein
MENQALMLAHRPYTTATPLPLQNKQVVDKISL